MFTQYGINKIPVLRIRKYFFRIRILILIFFLTFFPTSLLLLVFQMSNVAVAAMPAVIGLSVVVGSLP
jgi:hypothetical protein